MITLYEIACMEESYRLFLDEDSLQKAEYAALSYPDDSVITILDLDDETLCEYVDCFN